MSTPEAVAWLDQQTELTARLGAAQAHEAAWEVARTRATTEHEAAKATAAQLRQELEAHEAAKPEGVDAE